MTKTRRELLAEGKKKFAKGTVGYYAYELTISGNRKRTVQTWSTYLVYLMETIGDQPIKSVEARDLMELRQQVQEASIENGSKTGGWAAFETFTGAVKAVWAHAASPLHHEITQAENITLGLEYPKRQEARKRGALKLAQLDAINAYFTRRYHDPELGLLVVRSALELGARRDELLTLKATDLKTDHISVTGKGGNTRQQPATVQLHTALKAFAESRADSAQNKSRYVFVTRQGRPITRSWFEHTAKNIRAFAPELLGEQGQLHFTWHLMRYTAATNVGTHPNGGQGEAGAFLGHKVNQKADPTSIYAPVSFEKLQALHESIWNAPVVRAHGEDSDPLLFRPAS